MRTVNETIIRVATTPGKKITVADAKSILRNCGILNKNYQIENAYKDILLKSDEASGCTKGYSYREKSKHL